MSNTFSMLQFGDCVNLCLSVISGGGGEGGGLLIFGRGEGGVNANREVLQILDPQRLASLLGNLGISVRIHTQT